MSLIDPLGTLSFSHNSHSAGRRQVTRGLAKRVLLGFRNDYPTTTTTSIPRIPQFAPFLCWPDAGPRFVSRVERWHRGATFTTRPTRDGPPSRKRPLTSTTGPARTTATIRAFENAWA